MNELNEKHIALIPLLGMDLMAEKIKDYIKDISSDTICEVIPVKLQRFATGDAKAVLQKSVRGKDVFVLVDVGNYDDRYRYSMFDYENHLSPDDHFQNLVRTISAIGGKASRISVIMPLLYSARQDRRTSRESLDCAVALQHLEKIGIENIMSFDVHDARVQNAIPFMGFDNLVPTYQTIKALCRYYSDLFFDEQHMVMVSPDFGGMNRNFMYADVLGLDIGLFYKRRDVNEIEDGKNPILIHKYIGPDLVGKDVLIVDDIIASGESISDSVIHVKKMGAKRVFVGATFGFFTRGTKKFDEMYEEGLLESAFITNASYLKKEVIQAPWYKEVNTIKYISFYIYSVSTGISISNILDPNLKIVELIKKYRNMYPVK